MESLRHALECLLNKHSAENGSDTPDAILASYLVACLNAFDAATLVRDKWYDIKNTWARDKFERSLSPYDLSESKNRS